jgi:DNA-binding protein H-NS
MKVREMSINSIDDLNSQIKQLEEQRAQLIAEADKQRKETIATEIDDLIKKIHVYGITTKELGLTTGKAGKPKQARKSQGSKRANGGKTYTGPEGQTWTEGTRGRKPAWLVQQLSESAE